MTIPVQLAIYDSWFDPVLATLPTLVPNGFIYLRANPETCYRRMQKRSRSEESTVQLEYLQVREGVGALAHQARGLGCWDLHVLLCML